MNQYKRTKGALERAEGAMHSIREDATIADVLHELFEHDGEIELLPQILAGISEEMFVLGFALQNASGVLDTVPAGTMLIRLSRRLDLALAFEQRRAEDPGNYEHDISDERPSGEFPVTGGLARQSIVRPVSNRRAGGTQ